MGKIYMLACPKCGFSFPVDELLVAAKVDAHCPLCHHEFRPESAKPSPAVAGEGT